jgi:phage-related baseplate assembly protein
MAHDTISIHSSADSIDYQGTATITATSTSGAHPALTAAGAGVEK